MNLATLKAVVAAFHHVEITDLTKGEVDLFVVAANNARRKAEKRHDFENCKLSATLVVDGVSGGALTDAVISPSGKFKSIRQIDVVSGVTSGGRLVPLPFKSMEQALEDDRTMIGEDDWLDRAPSDWEVEQFAGGYGHGVVQRGGYLYHYPKRVTGAGPWSLTLEGSGWLNDYTDAQLAAASADPQDFFVEHGFDWLQWEIIIEMNYMFQTYVPRQEGNVGAPSQLRDEAWRDLVVWDSYSVDPAATGSR